MKTLLTLLFATLCAVSGYGQTLKSLMYNATNGRVVYAATNPLTFTNASLELGDVVLNSGGVFGYGREIYLEEGTISGEWTFNNAFSVNNASNAAVIRTNLSLGWPALTNSNSATQLLGVNTNGQVIANTGTNVLTFTNSVQVQNISVGYNIFSVGTDYDTFRGRFGNGDTGALEVHTTLDTFDIDPVTSPNYSGIASVGQGNVALTYKPSGQSVTWAKPVLMDIFASNIVSPTNSAGLRSALQLGASWLTNTNNENFRSAVGIPLAALTNTSNVTMMRALGGSTNTNEPYSGSVSLTNTNSLVFSNGVLLRIQ